MISADQIAAVMRSHLSVKQQRTAKDPQGIAGIEDAAIAVEMFVFEPIQALQKEVLALRRRLVDLTNARDDLL